MFSKLLLWLPAFGGVASLLLPHPNGPYAVSMFVQTLTDESRMDPYSPLPHKREILVSLFTPINRNEECCQSHAVQYMTPLVAHGYDQQAAEMGLYNNTFSSLQLQFCYPNSGSHYVRSSSRTSKFPILIFSPGLGNSRLIYGAMAQNIASLGYVVITIDHPYDASIVEFPNGKIVKGVDIDESNDTTLALATKVRAADANFVLDYLSTTKHTNSALSNVSKYIDLKTLLLEGIPLGELQRPLR